MARLTREQAVAPKWKAKIVEVPVPELGHGDDATLPVRQWSAKERQTYEASLLNSQTQKLIPSRARSAKVRVVIASCRGEDGEPLFTIDNDLEAISNWPAAVVERICEAQAELSGLGKDEIEELEKNSE